MVCCVFSLLATSRGKCRSTTSANTKKKEKKKEKWSREINKMELSNKIVANNVEELYHITNIELLHGLPRPYSLQIC